MARKKRERRKRGTGYAKRAPNGTWTAFYPKRPSGQHVRRGFDSRKSAEAWLDALAKRQEAKEDVSRGQQAVGAYIDAWAAREARERGWKAKTVADVAWKLGYVKPYLQDMALADVIPDDVDAMLLELGAALAETTTRQIRNYLHQVFQSAVERHYITFNPVMKSARRKRAKQREPVRLSVAQARLVLRYADGSFYALAWRLIFILGLRAGEVCGLRWGDIDYDAATITIAQEATDLRGTPHKDTPKGGKTRVLPLPRALIALFQAHEQAVIRRAAQGLQKGYWQQHGLVFPGRSGKPMHTTSLRHQLKRMTDALRLPPLTSHDGRHTAAKFYTDVGCPLSNSGPLLGHGPKTITGHYAPPDVEAMRPWVEQVYGLVAGEEKQRKEGIR